MPKAKDISNLKVFRNYLYADVTLSGTAKVTIRLPLARADVSEALSALNITILREAEKMVTDQSKSKVSDARAAARAEVASSVIGQIRRGTTPDELERSLAPLTRTTPR